MKQTNMLLYHKGNDSNREETNAEEIEAYIGILIYIHTYGNHRSSTWIFQLENVPLFFSYCVQSN